MLHQVIFEEYWRGIRVSAYTDLYAYNPENDSLVLISLAGTEQAVKAISSAIIGCQTVHIRCEGEAEILVSRQRSAHSRILTTKLPCGAVHQLVVDKRFFGDGDAEGRLVVIPEGEDVSRVVYSQILIRLASPLIPEWSEWICRQLKDRERMREMEGTLKVVEVSADEAIVDKIISEGVAMGRISLDRTGGPHAGIH